MRKVLVTVALPEEMFEMPANSCCRVVTTRVSKACAAYALTRAICSERPDIVVNMGSAGTLNMNIGDIVVPSHFIDRDLMPLAIEGVVAEISGCNTLRLPSVVGGKENFAPYTASTGDDFVTAGSSVAGDVVDMESFAQAMVCRNEGIPFVAVKYVTDVIGQNSVKVWAEKLADARTALGAYFAKHIAPLAETD